MAKPQQSVFQRIQNVFDWQGARKPESSESFLIHLIRAQIQDPRIGGGLVRAILDPTPTRIISESF